MQCNAIRFSRDTWFYTHTHTHTTWMKRDPHATRPETLLGVTRLDSTKEREKHDWDTHTDAKRRATPHTRRTRVRRVGAVLGGFSEVFSFGAPRFRPCLDDDGVQPSLLLVLVSSASTGFPSPSYLALGGIQHCCRHCRRRLAIHSRALSLVVTSRFRLAWRLPTRTLPRAASRCISIRRRDALHDASPFPSPSLPDMPRPSSDVGQPPGPLCGRCRIVLSLLPGPARTGPPCLLDLPCLYRGAFPGSPSVVSIRPVFSPHHPRR
ncbi:hypothetical protein C8R43DRAFT_358494 [Mycena crocata]|nr:hypothetical protein C8R43DRAFT_358494 [Mycena crocata]